MTRTVRGADWYLAGCDIPAAVLVWGQSDWGLPLTQPPGSPWCCSSWEDGSSVAQSTGSSLHIEALSSEHIICHQVPDQSGHTEDEGQSRFIQKFIKDFFAWNPTSPVITLQWIEYPGHHRTVRSWLSTIYCHLWEGSQDVWDILSRQPSLLSGFSLTFRQQSPDLFLGFLKMNQ